MRSITALASLAATVFLISGCGSSGSVSPGVALQGPGYWTHGRLLGARPWLSGTGGRSGPAGRGGSAFPTPNPSPTAHSTLRALRVGGLFAQSADGNHFCTASVVDSPGHNVLITAAHCINAGNGSGYRSNIVFIPDYADGNSPFGVWQPEKLIVDPRWASGADQDLDVGFIVLKPLDGKNIQDVLGANKLGINPGFSNVVRVTGYPDTASEPVTCMNKTTRQAAYQVKFACAGYPDGTSGSPWVVKFDPQSRTGTIVGVIGGYQQGGDTDSISYSTDFDSDIEKLYQEATSSETG
jgi:V8-like Glu-specific endopeptidase